MSPEKEFIVTDSGEREAFAGGAVRDTAAGKPRPDLISPFMLERLGAHMAKGAIKYAEWNWANGIPSTRCYESACRHMMMFAQGDRVEDHLSAAVFNLMVMIHNEEVERRGIIFTASTKQTLVNMPVFAEKREVSCTVSPKNSRINAPLRLNELIDELPDKCPVCKALDPLSIVEETTPDDKNNKAASVLKAKCRECGYEFSRKDGINA